MSKNETKFLDIQIPQNKVEEAKRVLKALRQEEERYIKASDISDIAFYENMKRRVLSYLSTLDNYKTTFNLEADRLEEYVKKTVRNKIIVDLVASKKASSYTAAERKVELDDKYISFKKQLWEFKTIAQSLTGRYWTYSNLFDSIVQSVSVAGKERRNTQMSN